jgi:hypothetical protein
MIAAALAVGGGPPRTTPSSCRPWHPAMATVGRGNPWFGERVCLVVLLRMRRPYEALG